ncbi:MAG: type IV pilin protein [Saccharofermentanales bacterium]|jgi:prepilin-type N-terminal cleavage/methylation domain-containing protein
MKKMNNKGFTLMEVLIVVAIIAVLVAIAIPVMTGQLEKAREATDIANIRSAYAEAAVNALTSADGEGSATSEKMVQTQDNWTTLGEAPEIGGTDVPAVTKGQTVTVTVDANGTVSFDVTGP